jgi:hypothetical protein
VAQRIERLTPEQQAYLPVFRQEYLNAAIGGKRADRPRLEAAISASYAEIGKAAPIVIIQQSPLQAMMAIKRMKMLASKGMGDQFSDQFSDHLWVQLRGQLWGQLRDQLSDQLNDLLKGQLRDQLSDQLKDQLSDHLRDQLSDQLGDESRDQPIYDANYLSGSQDLYWIAWAKFAEYIGVRLSKQQSRRLEIMRLIGFECEWWWPFEGFCFASERLLLAKFDDGQRLHSDDGPAVKYADGYSLFTWHGLRVPSWLIEDKARITPDAIEAEGNAELRRVMLEIFGFDRYIEARGARLIAEDECLGLPRQLFEIDLGGEPIRVLRVINGTVEADGRQRQLHLGVPLECNTPHEAVAWSYGRDPKRYEEPVRS